MIVKLEEFEDYQASGAILTHIPYKEYWLTPRCLVEPLCNLISFIRYMYYL
jgi:hypothetical protein